MSGASERASDEKESISGASEGAGDEREGMLCAMLAQLGINVTGFDVDTMLASVMASLRLAEVPDVPPLTDEQKRAVFDGQKPSLELLAAKILRPGARVVALVGAGISVACGIPDFRTPGTGLHANLAKYNLPSPEAVFSIGFFRDNPAPFYQLSRELFDQTKAYVPSRSHALLVLLSRLGVLRRVYTQNIDSIELAAGVPAELVVQVHGSLGSASCIECERPVPRQFMLDAIQSGTVVRCTAPCNGLLKPDIVFYGESLPRQFRTCMDEDRAATDVLLVMGTSLTVLPVSSVPSQLPHSVPRLLINRELVGDFSSDVDENYRDVCLLGDCDSGADQLAQALGCKAELDEIMAAFVGKPLGSQ